MDSPALRFVPAAGATGLVGLVVATRPLGAVPRAIALACVVASWGCAALLRSRSVRAHASVVSAIAAAIAAGQIDAGLPYGIACGLLVLGCVVTMRAARAVPASQPPGPPKPRVIALLGVTTLVVAASLIVGLPRLAAQIERRITAMFGGDGDEATAFSTTMVLGSTRGMLLSDTIVMRIDGKKPEYLRGAVYDRYNPPHWVTSGPGRQRHTVPMAAVADSTPDNPAATRITLVRGAPNGEDMRWFLPADACDITLPSGKLEIDAFGVARRGRGEDPPSILFNTGGCTTGPAPIAKPTATDLDVDPHVRRALRDIAYGWTAGATSDREKLAAIQRELSRFEYSLEVPRTEGLDPVVDFISVHRAGHCEMFASAMVLMARLEGIPARVIGGYRVTEVNPLTGRAVVRDRNAHAWVEAWVDGSWHGMDPTPASEAFAPRAGAADHVGDVVSSGLDRIASALSKLGLLGTALVLGVVVALLLLIRFIGTQFANRRSRKATHERALPLPCFDVLTRALAESGHERDDSEPIEAFAKRLATTSSPWARDAAQALLDYASLRYGGVGDEAHVVNAVERAARQVRSR